jgi:hypothetical protein
VYRIQKEAGLRGQCLPSHTPARNAKREDATMNRMTFLRLENFSGEEFLLDVSSLSEFESNVSQSSSDEEI